MPIKNFICRKCGGTLEYDGWGTDGKTTDLYWLCKCGHSLTIKKG